MPMGRRGFATGSYLFSLRRCTRLVLTLGDIFLSGHKYCNYYEYYTKDTFDLKITYIIDPHPMVWNEKHIFQTQNKGAL